jgi:hypothetical protein
MLLHLRCGAAAHTQRMTCVNPKSNKTLTGCPGLTAAGAAHLDCVICAAAICHNDLCRWRLQLLQVSQCVRQALGLIQGLWCSTEANTDHQQHASALLAHLSRCAYTYTHMVHSSRSVAAGSTSKVAALACVSRDVTRVALQCVPLF